MTEDVLDIADRYKEEIQEHRKEFVHKDRQQGQFYLLIGMQILVLCVMVWVSFDIRHTINATNTAVENQVNVLQDRNDELRQDLIDQEIDLTGEIDQRDVLIEQQSIVIAQAVQGFADWCDFIESLGQVCPRIELNPELGRPEE